MKEISLLCPAKINLTLDVLGLNSDGYHEIKSIMQTVSLYDEMTVSIGGSKIDLYTNLPYVPRDERNTAYKAAKYFFETVGATYGVRINVKKQIPVAAGMAGGSADGAGVVFALNMLFGSPLDNAAVTELCKRIGADVPFCYFGGTALAGGIGERLSVLPPMPDCSVVIIKPHGGLSAGEVYKRFDSFGPVSRPDTDGAIEALCKRDLKSLCEKMENVFEPVCIEMMPVIASVKAAFSGYGAVKVLMSGSGSSVFAVFDDKEKAAYCHRELSDRFDCCFLSSPTDKGIILK